MDKKWDWRYLAKNPNITLDFIEEIPDQTIGFNLYESYTCNIPWSWCFVSQNPNITIDYIKTLSK